MTPPVKSKGTARPAKPRRKTPSFLASETVRLDVVPDERAELARYDRLFSLLKIQIFAVAGLVGVLIFSMPIFLYAPKQYFSVDPKRHVVQLMSLTMPNMTNAAVISWTSTSITEIMTFGFGDFNAKLTAQRTRFSKEGWDSFRKAFQDMKLGEKIQEQHQVMTAVPSDTPIISKQGPNKDDIYEWTVQMPVIITFATFNNVTDHTRALVQLTIVRVPYAVSPMGIAIKKWETI